MTDPAGPDLPLPDAADWRPLVEAVLTLRADPAAARFAAELARARDAGRVDPETARTLLWWHRAALDEVAEHVVQALPDVIGAVSRARVEAVGEAARSAGAWDRAQPGAPAGQALVVGLTVLPDRDAGSAAPDQGPA